MKEFVTSADDVCMMHGLGRRFSTRWRQFTQHYDATWSGCRMLQQELNDVADATENCRRNHGTCTDWAFSL